MNFKQWLTESSIEMNPWEAMEIMQLQDLKGQVLDANVLRTKFFELSRKYHPDRNLGDDNSLEMMVKLNNANATLSKFIDKVLPSEKQETPSYSSQHEPSDFYSGFKKGRPKDSKTVSEQDVMAWCEETLQKNRTVLFFRHPYTGFDYGFRIGIGPYGSKSSRKTLPENTTPKDLFDIIKQSITNFPDSLIDIGHSKFESYLTFLNKSNNFSSISLETKKTPVKKEAGVGMKREEILMYFEKQGLTVLRQTKEADYFGFYNQPTQESTFIRVKQKKVDIVSVQKVDYGYKKVNNDVMVTKEFYFGTVTEKILDALIFVLKRRLKAKFNYETGI